MKKNSKVRALFSNRQFLVIFSLILSAVLWLFVATSLSPDFTTTVYGVPVSVKIEGTSLEKLNLHLFGGDDKTINITVTGKRYIVSQLTKDDFTVSVPLSKVTGPGTYNLNVTPEYTGNLDDFNIVDYSDKSMTFYFDYKGSKTLDIEADISELSFAEGYTADVPVLSKNTVEINGPKSEIDKIEKAVAHVSKDGNGDIDKALTITTGIIFYDKNGNEYLPQNVESSETEVSVTVSVDTTVTVPLTVNFGNVPSYFAESTLKYEIIPSEIMLSGNSDQLKSMESIQVGTINFEDINLSSNKFTADIPLPQGVSNVSGKSTCEIVIDLSEYKEETVEITSFKTVNVPEGIRIDVLTTALSDVKILIPKNLDTPSKNSLYAEIDIQNKDYSKAKYKLPVTIKSDTINKMWASGSYNASVEVK